MRIAKFISYLSLPLLYLVSSSAFAGVFDPPPSDKSVELLGMIFGSNVGTIFLGGAANPVLAAMFQKFNVIIVSLGTMIISYVGIVSTINTAQEGQAMGKKWSSIWVPMRSMLGMLLMVPTPGSGYSMIQVTVMWMIMQGIGAADQMWAIVLDALGQGLSASGGLSLKGGTEVILDNAGTKVAKDLLNSAVCMEAIKKINSGLANTDAGVPIVGTDFATNFGGIVRSYQTTATHIPADLATATTEVTYSATFNVGAKDAGAGGSKDAGYATMCGSYNVSATVNVNELAALNLVGGAATAEAATRAEDALNKKMLALSTMMSVLKPIAQNIVNGTVNEKNDPSKTHGLKDGPGLSPSGFMETAKNAYKATIGTIIKPHKDSALADAVDKGKRAGWIVAGSFYFVLTSSTDQDLLATHAIAPAPVDGTIPSCDKLSCITLAGISSYIDSAAEIKFVSDRLSDADIYSTNDAGTSAATGISLPGGGGGKGLSLMQAATGSAINDMAKMMKEKNGDPLIGHANFGSKLMIAAEVTWVVMMSLAILLSIPAGICASQASPWLIFITTFASIYPVIAAVLGSLWMFGASLAVYLPMVPYMIYTIAAMGWFIQVIEAIVAAPLIALGLVIPSGDELGKVAHGLMKLVNILLRPTLMIFGFILAARLYRAVITLVNFGMADTIASIPISGSMFAPLVAMGLYASFVISLANKCFALIYILPDKILSWIGGPSESTDASSLQETKQGTDKMAGEVKGAVGDGAAGGGVEKAGKNAQGQLDGKKADAASAASEAKQESRHQETLSAMKGGGGGGKSGGGDGGGKSGGGDGGGKSGGAAPPAAK